MIHLDFCTESKTQLNTATHFFLQSIIPSSALYLFSTQKKSRCTCQPSSHHHCHLSIRHNYFIFAAIVLCYSSQQQWLRLWNFK